MVGFAVALFAAGANDWAPNGAAARATKEAIARTSRTRRMFLMAQNPFGSASADALSAKRLEARAHLGDEELGLLPRREVAALGELVVVDELRIRPLRPPLRGGVDLLGKDAHGDGNLDAPGVEEAALRNSPEFPVEPRRGDRRVREPVVRDVVEDVVSAQAFRLAVEASGDHVVALRIVVEDPGSQADGGVHDRVESLRAERHFVGVTQAEFVEEGQLVPGVLLVGQ